MASATSAVFFVSLSVACCKDQHCSISIVARGHCIEHCQSFYLGFGRVFCFSSLHSRETGATL